MGTVPLMLALALCGAVRSAALGPSQSATLKMPAAKLLIERAMAADHIPAVAVTIRTSNAILWSEAFGVADIETRSMTRLESRFRLASVTKPFTAALARVLADKGRIDLRRPICRYDASLPTHHCRTTLKQLLEHKGGIRHYQAKDFDPFAPGGRPDMRLYPDRKSELSVFLDDPLVSAPGSQFHYSTFGYVLAAHILEKATGQSFEALLKLEITGPRALETIDTDHVFELRPGRVASYDPADEYRELDPGLRGHVVRTEMFNSMFRIPAGGLIGSASDVAKFGIGEIQFLRGSSAPGWSTEMDTGGHRAFYATGSQQGSRSILYVIPDRGLSIAVMTNLGDRPKDIRALGRQLAALVP